MSQTTEPFRLKQKIDGDVLGEVYCAAWQDEGGDEELALLRIFDREGLDPARFEERSAERRELWGERLSDHLSSCHRQGVAGGRAFDLFEGVSGRSLARLIQSATRQRRSVPLEVALFVAGRLAAGLADAYRRQIDGAGVVHGFVVPHLVMVTEEGRVRLCGLEAAPALREFRGTAAAVAEILPYLSPESVAEGDLQPSDDVYSVGALLYELLTLKPLASASDLRVDNGEIPCELRYLLARSVAPRPLRIQSAVEWLRELKALVVQEGWAAGAADLSAYLAEIDERDRPAKPDTTEITADDRRILEEALRSARRASGEGGEAGADTPDPAAAGGRKGAGYDTGVLAGKDLEPLRDEGRLVRTTHVKRVAESPPAVSASLDDSQPGAQDRTG